MIVAKVRNRITWSKPMLDVGVMSASSAIGLVVMMLVNFLAPSYLSQGDYGLWRSFLLYSGYGGLLHLGLVEGILIRWAGSPLEERTGEIRDTLAFLVAQQVIILLILAAAGSFVGRVAGLGSVWVITLAYIVVSNLLNFFQYSLQAFKVFGFLAISRLASQAALLLGIIILGLCGQLTATSGIILSSVATVLATVVAFLPLWKTMSFGDLSIAKVWRSSAGIIRLGIFYYAGTFATALFFGLDKLAVSASYSSEGFALYAFPSALLGAIYTLVAAVTSVAFPYLSERSADSQADAYSKTRSLTIVTWGTSLAGYFLMAVAVNHFLPSYSSSLQLLRILLLSVGVGSLIRSTHYNYYRIALKKWTYFLTNGGSLALFALLLVIGIKIGWPLELIAWCTVLSTSIWFIVNEWALQSFLRSGWKEDFAWPVGGLVAFAVGFGVISAWNISLIAEMLLYVGWSALVISFLFRKELHMITQASAIGLRALKGS